MGIFYFLGGPNQKTFLLQKLAVDPRIPKIYNTWDLWWIVLEIWLLTNKTSMSNWHRPRHFWHWFWVNFYLESTLFWGNFYFESTLILSQLLFWVKFYFESTLILSQLLFWVNFDFESTLILNQLWFSVNFDFK